VILHSSFSLLNGDMMCFVCLQGIHRGYDKDSYIFIGVEDSYRKAHDLIVSYIQKLDDLRIGFYTFKIEEWHDGLLKDSIRYIYYDKKLYTEYD